jgi:MFS superfamily sulfate permease-like transporter
MIQERRNREGYGIGSDLVHIGQGFLALSLLWDFIAHIINDITQPRLDAELLPTIGLLSISDDVVVGTMGLCRALVLPPEVCKVITVCVVSGILIYLVFKLVCEMDWVQIEISWEECWEEFTWYNPWDWFTTLVCITKTAFIWVLQKICRYIGYIVTVLIITCIVVGIIGIA